MSVSSVEALEALPPGTTIVVNGVREFSWTRVEGGWALDGALLSSPMFAGHIAAGQVVDRSAVEPQVGQWKNDGAITYLITSLTSNPGYITALSMDGGNDIPIVRRVRPARVRRMSYSTDQQIAAACTPTVIRWLAQQMFAAQAATTEVAAERDQRTQEVRALKNRPDTAEVAPQVDAIATVLSQASEAVRVLGQLVRGNAEF